MAGNAATILDKMAAGGRQSAPGDPAVTPECPSDPRVMAECSQSAQSAAGHPRVQPGIPECSRGCQSGGLCVWATTTTTTWPSPPPPALLLPLAALNQLLAAGAISFQLPSNARKCLREEIHKDRLVTDSSPHILYYKEEAMKGKFAFTTDDYDMFEICFESRLPPGHFRVPDQLIILNTKHGVEAKNYEDIAKAEKLKPLEVELRRLEDLSESIVNDFADMKQREEEMRDTNGKDAPEHGTLARPCRHCDNGRTDTAQQSPDRRVPSQSGNTLAVKDIQPPIFG
ncbi:transmembrane emp24 domain-containing protein 10-like [Heptranchias perlo]|uniref:transmembrane emp24 domain-containing protein 10-like n=1 Tax=Heptranchias perlo TaxID=212740 RepID=UPI003559EBC7